MTTNQMPSETDQLALCEKVLALTKLERDVDVEVAVALDAVYQSRAFEVSQYGDELTFFRELGKSKGWLSKRKRIGEAIREGRVTVDEARECRAIESLYLAARQPTREQAEEVLGRAAHLTFLDLKKTVDGSDECKHDFAPVKMEKCRKCGRLQTCG